jgi:hypothetical protein
MYLETRARGATDTLGSNVQLEIARVSTHCLFKGFAECLYEKGHGFTWVEKAAAVRRPSP